MNYFMIRPEGPGSTPRQTGPFRIVRGERPYSQTHLMTEANETVCGKTPIRYRPVHHPTDEIIWVTCTNCLNRHPNVNRPFARVSIEIEQS